MPVQVKRVQIYTGHRDSVYALAAANDRKRFYTGGGEGYVVGWNMDGNDEGQLLVQVPGSAYSLAEIPESNRLLIGTSQGSLHVVNLETRAEEKNIQAHSKGIFDIKIYDKKIYTSGGDGQVCVYDGETINYINSSKVSAHSCRIMNFENGFQAVGSSDGNIYFRKMEAGEEYKKIVAHSNSVFAVAYSPGAKTLLSGGRDAKLKRWDMEKYILTDDIAAHLLHINQIVYSPDGSLVATASMDKTIKIWERETLKLLKVIDKLKGEGHTSSVNKLVWTDDENIISISDDRTAMHWHIYKS